MLVISKQMVTFAGTLVYMAIWKWIFIALVGKKFCNKERKIMAIEIKAIPTLEGKDAERFIERADEAERKFKGFDGIENTPAFKAMQNILRKSGMTK